MDYEIFQREFSNCLVFGEVVKVLSSEDIHDLHAVRAVLLDCVRVVESHLTLRQRADGIFCGRVRLDMADGDPSLSDCEPDTERELASIILRKCQSSYEWEKMQKILKLYLPHMVKGLADMQCSLLQHTSVYLHDHIDAMEVLKDTEVERTKASFPDSLTYPVNKDIAGYITISKRGQVHVTLPFNDWDHAPASVSQICRIVLAESAAHNLNMDGPAKQALMRNLKCEEK